MTAVQQAPAVSEQRMPGAAAGNAIAATTPTGRPYLAFRLEGEVYAIDILRIREIIEYSPPTTVPLMPPSLRGVINLRGAAVPVIDLAVRFGRAATGIGKRTCFVIVEIDHGGANHVLGLMVDGVNAVMEIESRDIEPVPTFGTRVNAEFIEGMARISGRFVIILAIEKVLSIEDMAAIKGVEAAP